MLIRNLPNMMVLGLLILQHSHSFSTQSLALNRLRENKFFSTSPANNQRYDLQSYSAIPAVEILDLTDNNGFATSLSRSLNDTNSTTQDKNETDNGEDKTKSDVPKPMDNVNAFEADIKKIVKGIRAGDDTSLYPASFATKKSRMSISYVWNLQMWRKHTSRTRYLNHMRKIFSSRLLKRIYPQLSVFVVWSVLYTFVIAKKVNDIYDTVPMTSLSLVSTFVGFLLTLRSNQGLSRLGEGRELWGRMFIVTRDTAQLLATYVYSKDKKLGIKSARYLAIFPWLLKGLLRDTDDTDIIDVMLPGSPFLKSQRKKPAACIARIRQVVAHLAARNVMPVAAHQQLELNLNEMNHILGMCERLKGSPIPPVYTSHTSRLLVFYLFFLPVALSAANVKNIVNVLVAVAVAYAMLGLDEISHLLEQPFQLMPIHELSRNMMVDVADAFVCQPPLLKAKSELQEEEEFLYPFDENNTAPAYW
jgi:putative membrane protein